MTIPCKHPQVRVVAREDDVEFVECQTCREVFDSAEYVDMTNEIEEAPSGEDRDSAAVSSRTAPGRR